MTLVILAAGMGSRYGGMKQIDPIGPLGEFIIDYSCHDAVKAGFDHIVFVIKEENLKIFRDTVGKRVEPRVKVDYAFQRMTDLPEGFSVPEGRVKPWGTAHAVLAAEKFVTDNFATINADDFYGAGTFKLIASELSAAEPYADNMKLCMAGFRLNNTLTENGSVSRGICEICDGRLTSITERTAICPDGQDAYYEENGEKHFLSGQSMASMNLFGLTPAIFGFIRKKFITFLGSMKNPLKDEFYLPTAVTMAMNEGTAEVSVCTTPEKWFGVTYSADKAAVQESVRALVKSGKYSEDLWSDIKKTGPDVLEIASHFDLPSAPVSYKECRVGHINSTYFVKAEDGSKYVLQRINTNVFKNPEGLMENVFGVTEHIRKKLAASGGDTKRGTLRFRRCRCGKGFYSDAEGNAWRVYDFVDGVVSLQSADCPATFASVGRAFGNFQMQLADCDASKLCETIPDFHNTAKRFDTFIASLEADKAGRAASVAEEIKFVKDRKEVCSYIVNGISSGRIPVRVTHNDTKLNNLLMDEKTLEPVCVIDLDTIMPGSVLFDFGDAIRFGASSAAEDETDLSKVFMKTEYFDAFASGFIPALCGSLDTTEIAELPMGALIITLETGIRFLTDYLDGDVYFRTEYPNHNLDRARNQFKLVADMECKLPEMKKIIEKYM